MTQSIPPKTVFGIWGIGIFVLVSIFGIRVSDLKTHVQEPWLVTPNAYLVSGISYFVVRRASCGVRGAGCVSHQSRPVIRRLQAANLKLLSILFSERSGRPERAENHPPLQKVGVARLGRKFRLFSPPRPPQPLAPPAVKKNLDVPRILSPDRRAFGTKSPPSAKRKRATKSPYSVARRASLGVDAGRISYLVSRISSSVVRGAYCVNRGSSGLP